MTNASTKRKFDKNLRKQLLRRDLNDLIRNPEGKVSESKLYSNIGKIVAIYLLVAYAESVLKSYDVLLVLLGFVVVPDILKKAISMKYSHAEDKK